MNLRKFLIGTGLVMVGIAALLLGVQTYERSQSFRGSLIEPSPPAWPIELELADGTQFSLDEQKGKVVLLFFGYANCPDFCPTTLAEFKQIHDALGPDQLDRVEFVFISIDPERDSPQAIGDFVHGFDSDFIGLSGSEEELQPIWDGYFVYREKQEVGSEAGYLMAHTTRVYVVDKQSRLRLTFPYGMAAEDMSRDIRRLLEE